jgi:hypothetical protein
LRQMAGAFAGCVLVVMVNGWRSGAFMRVLARGTFWLPRQVVYGQY